MGFNQRRFAAACGLNRTYVGGVGRGERNVTFSVLCTLCATLGCDVAALTEGIPDLAPGRTDISAAIPKIDSTRP